MRAIGFWFSTEEQSLPRPQWLVDPAWSADERAAVGRYLRAGARAAHWYGYSWCRFGCDIENGALDLTDGAWLWPEGLAHYVEAHSVRVPDELIARAIAPRASPPGSGDERRVEVDHDWWLRWAAERGACVVLDPGWIELDMLEASAAGRQLHELGALDDSARVWRRRHDGDAILSSDFRVLSLRTGQLLAGDPRSADHVVHAPPLAVPTEAELRAWASQIVARPMVDIMNPVLVWVPDGLDAASERCWSTAATCSCARGPVSAVSGCGSPARHGSGWQRLASQPGASHVAGLT